MCNSYEETVIFRSPERNSIPHLSVNGERARRITTSPWLPRRPVIKLPLRGKPQLIPNVQGRSRFVPDDRSLSRRTAAQP
ncbi:hypothetical protein [Buttiauxella noackiae]|uniref:hypothetical protein n=1 Tax=Buttiauxella noackiae TaxID=82992 RepID=UPI0035A67EC8